MSFLTDGAHPRPRTILILDADPASRAAIRATLGKSGFATIAVANHDDAVGLCTDATVDMAIVDSDDGRATIEWLRARDADVKVLALSQDGQATTHEQLMDAALRTGADRALSRPFTLSYLVHVVHEMVTPFKASAIVRDPHRDDAAASA